MERKGVLAFACLAALAVVGCCLTTFGLSGLSHFPWARLAGYVALVAAAGALLGVRSMTVQVLARGVLWSVVGSGAFVVWEIALVFAGYEGTSIERVHASGFALLALVFAAAALHRARPELHRGWARAAFAPVRARGAFLAGATASAAVGIALVCMCGPYVLATMDHPVFIRGLAALGAASIVAGIGIARMRAWGVLLAGATTVVVAVAMLFTKDARLLYCMFPVFPWVEVWNPLRALGPLPFALPGVWLVSTVLVARARRGLKRVRTGRTRQLSSGAPAAACDNPSSGRPVTAVVGIRPSHASSLGVKKSLA